MNVYVLNFKELYMEKLKEYEDRNVYNCEETGLFWKCSLNITYTISKKIRQMVSFLKIQLLYSWEQTCLEKN